MPITLACPSCAKRFRARDESAGKKVKCPYCQAAVPVPSADGAAAPAAEPPPARPATPPARPSPAAPAPVVASPDDWGANPAAPKPKPFEPAPEPAPADLDDSNPFQAPPRTDKPRPMISKADPKGAPEGNNLAKKGPKKSDTTADPRLTEEVLARKWAGVRRGLLLVQFALLFVALMGFVGFGKALYVKSVGELPTGEGWVTIEGYVNGTDKDAVPISKTEEINILAYGLPALAAGFFLTVGRLLAGRGPRNSGAPGLFVLSGALTLVALVAFLGWRISDKMQFREEARYAVLALLISAPLAEFWFLTGLTASGLALKRPGVARAVGLVGLMFALVPAVTIGGWDLYVQYARPKPKDLDADWLMYEQAALLMGWLIAVAAYWRAVRSVRAGALEFIQTVEDAADDKGAPKEKTA
ncbi:MAG: hypothetical protein ACKODX_23000 [Gemmata sp.]